MQRQHQYIKYKLIVAILLIFTANIATAQNTPKQESLLGSAYKMVTSNPDESIKIGQHLLKNEQTDSEKAAINLLIAQSYFTKGNYNSTIIHVFEAGKYSDASPDTTKIEILLFKAELLKALYLDKQAKIYANEAQQIIGKIPSKAIREQMATKVLLYDLRLSIERQDIRKAQQLLENAHSLKRVLSVNPELGQKFDIARGKIFNGLAQHDSAHYYLHKSLDFANNIDHLNFAEKVVILNELGRLHFQNKQYQKAIGLLSQSETLARKLKNVPLLKSVNRQLAINYLGLNDRQNYKLYNGEFLRLNNDLEQAEQESVNTTYNLISKEQETFFSRETRKQKDYFYNTLIVGIVIIIVLFLLWLKSWLRKKRLKEIINYLEISRNIFTKTVTDKKEPNKKIIIPIETEQAILSKLKRFEASVKYTNNEMSLAMLAAQLDTNTKYLSEIINKHYGTNFNTYINKLRINYIIEKLKNDPNYMHYKISYLAENSGFSTHSSFATIFKSITGIAPMTFIELLKEEKEQENFTSHV